MDNRVNLEQETFYSSVSSEFKKKALFRGTFIAILGLIPLVWSAVFLPKEWLAKWGVWLFFYWVGMSAWGLVPYRRLVRLETEPHILTFTKKGFTISFHGKDPFTIPAKQVEALSYLKGKNEYGIMLELNKPLPSGRTMLFLPFFSERAFNNIHELFC